MIENEYLHTISNAFGQFHAALLSGNKGLSNLLINQRIKWNNFTFIYITNVKGVLDVQNILGIGRDGAFQEYITEHYKTSMFAIDYQTKELFGGKRVEDLLKEKEVSRCKIIDPDFRRNTYGYMCNLEYVYFNKENKKQYKNVYRINEKNIIGFHLYDIDRGEDNSQKFILLTKKKIFIRFNTKLVEEYDFDELIFCENSIQKKGSIESIDDSVVDYAMDVDFINYIEDIKSLHIARIEGINETHPVVTLSLEKKERYLSFLVDLVSRSEPADVTSTVSSILRPPQPGI